MSDRPTPAQKAVETMRKAGTLFKSAEKAVRTKRSIPGYLEDIAARAAETRAKPASKARRTERASRDAFATWATENGLFHVFLDWGTPTTGIVDALLIRVDKHDRDQLEIELVQIKAGSAKLGATERRRLIEACKKVRCVPAAAFWDTETNTVGRDLISFP